MRHSGAQRADDFPNMTDVGDVALRFRLYTAVHHVRSLRAHLVEYNERQVPGPVSLRRDASITA